MADKALTDLPDGGAATSGDVIYVVRGGNSRKAAFPTIPAGTVTSVSLSLPTGLEVSGSPVTTSGTFTVTWSSGYQGYTTDEASKLSGIEAGADVTDATNVAAAGAVMDGDFSSNGLMTRTGAGTYGITAIGTGAGTVAAGDDSRITGAVQKAGTGQVLTGSYLHTPYNYGNLGSSTITLNPANGLTGKITRTSGSGTIEAPTGTPSGFFNMLVAIVGTSSTGSTSLSGFDHVDGDDLPGNNQTAALYVECCPDYKLALVKGVKGY